MSESQSNDERKTVAAGDDVGSCGGAGCKAISQALHRLYSGNDLGCMKRFGVLEGLNEGDDDGKLNTPLDGPLCGFQLIVNRDIDE